MRRCLLACVFLSACGTATSASQDAASGHTDTALGDTAPATGCVQPIGGTSQAHVLRFEAESPLLRVHVSRREAGPGVGESVLYELGGLWIEQAGSCTAITEKAQLRYTNSHHNWRDVAIGTAAGVEHRVAIDYEPGVAWKIALSATEVASGRVVLGATALVPTGGPIGLWGRPTHLPVHISELMPDNRSVWKDDTGDFDPWIELFNPSSDAVDLGGYSLSPDPTMRRRWTFPPGTMIGRHQHLVVVADNQPEQGPLHATFRLASPGSVVLTGPSGVTAGERSYTAGPNQSLVLDPARDGFAPSASPSPGGGGM